MERLTPREFELLLDREFLQTKRIIHRKVTGALRAAELPIRDELLNASYDFPPDLLSKAGKISHGENYRELPYWVLDYPRKFQKNETFAFRTMVWWGHEISCTLHIGGSLCKQLRFDRLMNDFFFCIHDNPWEYHFEEDNYLPVQRLSTNDFQRQLADRGFVKIAKRWPLDELDQLPDLAGKCFHDALISVS